MRPAVGLLIRTLVPTAALAGSLAPVPGLAQAGHGPGAVIIGQQRAVTESGKPVAILEYAAPASATWGPSPTGPPTFAFGKPAQVLLVIPGGYVVRQEIPLDEVTKHAAYVSAQIGQPVAVTIPDPAGGPARVEYVGTSRNDR